MALTGAIAAIGSLWAPWYALTVTGAVRSALTGHVRGVLAPSLAQYAKAGVSVSSPQASAWQIFGQTNVAVAVLGLAVLLVVFAAAGSLGTVLRLDLAIAGSICAALGGACLAIIANRALHPVGGAPALHAGVVKVSWGAWIGLAGGVAMVGGGLWAAASGSGEAASDDEWGQARGQADANTSSQVATEDEARVSVAPPQQVTVGAQ
jgi:hypothetical protein